MKSSSPRKKDYWDNQDLCRKASMLYWIRENYNLVILSSWRLRMDWGAVYEFQVDREWACDRFYVPSWLHAEMSRELIKQYCVLPGESVDMVKKIHPHHQGWPHPVHEAQIIQHRATGSCDFLASPPSPTPPYDQCGVGHHFPSSGFLTSSLVSHVLLLPPTPLPH